MPSTLWCPPAMGRRGCVSEFCPPAFLLAADISMHDFHADTSATHAAKLAHLAVCCIDSVAAHWQQVLDEKQTAVYKRALEEEYKLKMKASRCLDDAKCCTML